VGNYGALVAVLNKDCRSFDSFAPARSTSGLPVYVARVPAAPFCEMPRRLTQMPYNLISPLSEANSNRRATALNPPR